MTRPRFHAVTIDGIIILIRNEPKILATAYTTVYHRKGLNQPEGFPFRATRQGSKLLVVTDFHSLAVSNQAAMNATRRIAFQPAVLSDFRNRLPFSGACTELGNREEGT